jgi:3',5'-cyclic AMP phosphodiesterase CpdA
MEVRFATLLFAVANSLFALGCGGMGPPPSQPRDARAAEAFVASVDARALDTDPVRVSDAAVLELVGAPLIFAPTAHGFGINAVLRSGDPAVLRARVRDESALDWTDLGAPTSPAADIAQWAVVGLEPGRRYAYELRVTGAAVGAQEQSIYLGSAVTAREPGSAFTFALLTDSHIQPRDPIPSGTTVNTDFYGFDESTLISVASDISASNPDFLIHLGDMLDYHLFGFNEPPPDRAWSRLGYLNYRRLLGDTIGHAAHFPVIGNWDGEDGFFTPEEIQRSSSQRMLYVPGPHPDTYPQGGSPNEDYYAFTWGDALFVALNVMTYTPTPHLLGANPGLPDDWTLGDEQRTWLEQTLAAATSRWRFLFIHHTVGGAAGNATDSAYGRGGGQAARVGEQSVVHDMMLKFGVQIFFYGHDHVFTDLVVDGIHYTLPGSAGAPWKFDTSATGYAKYWPDSGYGRVQVSQERVQVDFVAVGGQILSSYSLNQPEKTAQ